MSKISVDPYLFFKGNAREAMEFYQGVFGGELDFKTYADLHMPAEGIMKEDSIMHGYLSGGDAILMASDTNEASEVAAKISISVGGDDEARLTEIFNKLCDDVEPSSPLKKEVWGDIFGTVTDKYGIEWMINIAQPAQ